MQPDPDDRTDELTEQRTPGHSIPDVLSMLKSSETSSEGVDDVTAAYPDGTRMYMQVNRSESRQIASRRSPTTS